MKKVVSLALILGIVLAVFPFSAAATENETDLNDMFEYDIELTDEQVVKYLEKCCYDPTATGSTVYPYVTYICCRVFETKEDYATDAYGYFQQYENPYADGGFETKDELLEYFHKLCGIKEEYFNKYLVTDPLLNNALPSRDGKYHVIKYMLYVRPELTAIVNEYDSYERAYFFAKLYYFLLGDFRDVVNDLPSNIPKNRYYYLDDSEARTEPDYCGDTVTDPTEYITKILPFDANFDGEANARDSIILKKVLLGVDVKCNYYTRDLNGDGATNAKDSFYLKKFLATGEDARSK